MNKKAMNKKGLGTTAMIVIALIVIIGGIYVLNNLQEIKEKLGIQQVSDFIKVRLYDSNGNLIPTTSLSIVQGVPGVSYIDLTVTATNIGDTALTCVPTTLTPTAFDSAMAKTSQVILATGSKMASWTSNLISVGQFEGLPTPDEFMATIRCYYTLGDGSQVFLDDKTGSLSLTIEPDATGAFEVEVSTGGTGTEFCGDGICQSNLGETVTNCPQDCAVSLNVQFRTSDLSYVSGSGIAYTLTCGDVLTRYGHSMQTGLLSGTCDVAMPTLAWCGTTPTKLLDIPGALVSASTGVELWQPIEAGIMCVCDDNGANYKVVKYSITDTDYSKVSNIVESFDSAKEVTC